MVDGKIASHSSVKKDEKHVTLSLLDPFCLSLCDKLKQWNWMLRSFK